MASIASAVAAPKPLTKNPAEAAPRMIPALATNELIAFPFCSASSGNTEGSTPAKAGQKTPHKIPKAPFTKIKTSSGTSPIAKK